MTSFKIYSYGGRPLSLYIYIFRGRGQGNITKMTEPLHSGKHFSKNYWRMFSRLPYYSIFGGASALTKNQFMLVNGFSNVYFGWGGEDDDMSQR